MHVPNCPPHPTSSAAFRRFSWPSQSSSVGAEATQAAYSACRSLFHSHSCWEKVSAGGVGRGRAGGCGMSTIGTEAGGAAEALDAATMLPI